MHLDRATLFQLKDGSCGLPPLDWTEIDVWDDENEQHLLLADVMKEAIEQVAWIKRKLKSEHDIEFSTGPLVVSHSNGRDNTSVSYDSTHPTMPDMLLFSRTGKVVETFLLGAWVDKLAQTQDTGRAVVERVREEANQARLASRRGQFGRIED